VQKYLVWRGPKLNIRHNKKVNESKVAVYTFAFRCQFRQHFLCAFLVQKSFLAAFSCYFLVLAPKILYEKWTRKRWWNWHQYNCAENSCYVGRLKNIKIARDIPKGCLLHMRLVSGFLNTLGEKWGKMLDNCQKCYSIIRTGILCSLQVCFMWF